MVPYLLHKANGGASSSATSAVLVVGSSSTTNSSTTNDTTPSASASTSATPTTASNVKQRCPQCQQLVPVDELERHMRVELLDPKWKEQKERELSKKRESNLMESGALRCVAFDVCGVAWVWVCPDFSLPDRFPCSNLPDPSIHPRQATKWP